jgi:photosynthetic reaction center H subunit
MIAGAVLARFDVAQIAIYVFWLFFAGLIYYLRREDHREGYPLVPDFPGQGTPREFPLMPAPKQFLMADGTVSYAPRAEDAEHFAAGPALPWPGAPFEPTGSAMKDAVGPAAYALRADVPEHAYDDGLPKVVPLRSAADFFLADEDPDPRGYSVFAADGVVAGTVVDAWIDRSEYIARYLEVETTAALGGRRVLLPMHYAQVKPAQSAITTGYITAAQFADVPAHTSPDTVTSREEDAITAYYAGGMLYAMPGRLGPVL